MIGSSHRVGLLVDLFGTLVPKWSARRGIEAKHEMARAAGVPAPRFIEAWNSTWEDRELGRATVEDSLGRILTSFGYAPSAEVIEQVLSPWRKLMRDHLVARGPEISDTLRWCRSSGVPVALLSNAGPDVPSAFGATPMASLVDAAFFSCEIGRVKPDAEAYELACRSLSLEPQACVFVGDGGDNELAGARRVGMTPVWLRIQEEINEEGLPEGVADWDGPVIDQFMGVRDFLPREGVALL
jgi:putative hydrolase of the HAD superfamily